MDTAMDTAVEAFLGDQKLSELCEVVKAGDDLLDVINLSENQHSDLLAWMLDPREGHGQGDLIVRDLLLAGHEIGTNSSELDGRSATARFFSAWPPSRIRTASFSSVFTARELGMQALERVDLFVIDPANHFVLLIENKAGTAHSEQQLDDYRHSWQLIVSKHAHLKEYSCVFIALDKMFDVENNQRPSDGYWLHMGYDWLKPASDRAKLQLERGNAAAQLIVSYCSQQFYWANPKENRAISLAASLHETHAAAIRHLLGNTTGRLEKNWLKNKACAPEIFMLQNRSAVALLRQTRGMTALKETLVSKVPVLGPQHIYCTRARLEICPPGWEQFTGDEDYWPVYFSIRYANNTQTKYDLILAFNVSSAKSAYGELLRESLTKFDRHFAQRQNSVTRRVVLEKDLSASELATKVAEHLKRLLNVTQNTD